ncbi:MAG: hypothetical protein CMM87_04740 [Rickettsiales bacterium]|nr:hypothetical protein [Rickettsiales bacterium]|tara:strand:- start:10139 stop:10993 length:855 start_codon:yes stop_codon:yes gene_type:complete
MQSQSKVDYIFSILFHGIVLICIYFAGYFSPAPKPLVPKSIPLKIMPVKDKTRLQKKIKKTTKKENLSKKDKVKPVRSEKTAPKNKPKKADKPEKVLPVKDKIEKKLPTKKAKETKKEDSRLNKVDEKPTKKDTKEKDDFFEVMKTVEDLKSSPDKKPDIEKKKEDKSEPDLLPDQAIEDILSLSELDALRQQISSCWRLPAGVQGAQNLIIRLKVSMNNDRTVQSVEMENSGPETRDPVFVVAYESAKRALFHPKCTPLKLPASKFSQWKNFKIIFNPKEMII